MIDAARVKERTSLKELFEGDGHVLKRVGSSFVCLSPFQEEKTPSCYVHEREGYFKCHSSGVGGDCFTYWELMRKVKFAERCPECGGVERGRCSTCQGLGIVGALADLARRVGLVDGTVPERKLQLVPRVVEPPPVAGRMGGAALATWLAAVERLRTNEAQQERISSWRGYSLGTVQFALEGGLLGWLPFKGSFREAFLIERPENEGMVPIGYHIRLGPHTPANDSAKASWRYSSLGLGSWPFVLGDVFKARAIFCVEGPWDALALVDAMGWSNELPERTAIVAMRGAHSWKRLVEFFTWPKDARFLFICDADAAGRGWFAEGGFVETVYPRAGLIWAFWPEMESGKDFNDWWKERPDDAAQTLELFRVKTAPPPVQTAAKLTFGRYCRHERERGGKLGEAAIAVHREREKPRGRAPFMAWKDWWSTHLPNELHGALEVLWKEWLELPERRPMIRVPAFMLEK